MRVFSFDVSFPIVYLVSTVCSTGYHAARGTNYRIVDNAVVEKKREKREMRPDGEQFLYSETGLAYVDLINKMC